MIKRVLPVAIALTFTACLTEPDDAGTSTASQETGTYQECPPGETWDCYPHDFSTDGIGACQRGTKTCDANGFYGECVGDIGPTTEVCGDDIDNDCDGTTDEDCGEPEGDECLPGETWDCYPHDFSTDGIGLCQRGTKTCDANGYYGACVGDIGPVTEVCGDGLDNDCDTLTDEGCEACVPSPETCGDGLDNDCDGAVDDGCCVPTTETCGDGLDNDCDGAADEGCVCAPLSSQACYDGPPGTEGVGICSAGEQTCNPAGTGYGACVGSVTPTAEVCGDGLDNDCDGEADDGCCFPIEEICGNAADDDCDGAIDETCVCAPGATQACYAGPAGTQGVGVCTAGVRTCNADGTAYGACTGSVTPGTEVCGNGLDDDCDGQTDEGCLGDRAWNDRDRDGIQDPGEAGVGGATFILRTDTGAVVSVAVSAPSTGAYWFTNIPPGDYYIEVIPPFSYTLSGADNGGDDTADNDFDGESGATTIFSFSGSSSIWDAGFYFVIQT